MGVARDGNLGSLNGREFFFFFVFFVFVCRWVLVVLWSREVRILGHGAHGSMQDDELYILALRSWVWFGDFRGETVFKESIQAHLYGEAPDFF